jgi:probable HAF family extracellular repeat protein
MAKAINNGGDIVGQATDTSGNGRAVRWSHDGSIVDLNTLIPQGLGWTLTDAAAINNLGQIVGSGMHNGQARAYLLTPQ